MRAAVAAADRRQEVREAARAWQRRGAIDAAALAAIEAAYPDDRRRLGPVFRLLVFGFTVVAISALFGLFGLAVSATGEGGMAALLTVWGLILVAATEVQIGAGRRRQGGTEAATAFLGAGNLLFGLAWSASQALELRGEAAFTAALALSVLVCGLAAWRWGYSVFAIAAGAAAFVLAARTPAGRLLWVLGGAVLAPLLARAGEAPQLPPAHRRGCRALAVVALAFLYLGVHIGSWDAEIVEELGGGGGARGSAAPRAFAAIATGVVPLLALGWGVARRRRWLIAAGVAGIVASLVTLRAYVHVAPLWTVLIAGGACCLGLAAALRRYLDSGPHRERAGLTADPLFEEADRHGALELAVGAVTLTPDARAPESPAALQPGGGAYGGGGASGRY